MLRLLLGSSILGFLVGGLTTTLTHFLPSNLICYLAVIFVAVGMLGRLVYLMSVSTKIDSTIGLVVAGILAGTFGFYASWGTYLMFELNQFNLRAYHPTVLMRYAIWMVEAVKDRGESGVTSLHLIWLFESAMFLVIVPCVARANASKDTKTFCKPCKSWYEAETGFMRLRATDGSHEAIGGMRIAACTELPFATIDDDPHVRLDLSACRSCMQSNSIRTTLVTYEGANETLQDWTPVSEAIARQLHDRKPEYERFVDA